MYRDRYVPVPRRPTDAATARHAPRKLHPSAWPLTPITAQLAKFGAHRYLGTCLAMIVN